ncbi:MAG TPA: hypothetical protein VJ276_04415 [Thermoanaerobaculia bacterium]|nr:hypothetical protein [Thermoanaerobaculia bacterium]
MHRSIGALTHGIIDYAMVIFLIAGPSVAGFRGRQAAICYALAAVHLILTLVTRFPLGALKVLGFPLHGGIELIVGLLLVVLPWLASFSAGLKSRNFFVAVGLLIILIWFLTDYRGLRADGRATPPAPPAR